MRCFEITPKGIVEGIQAINVAGEAPHVRVMGANSNFGPEVQCATFSPDLAVKLVASGMNGAFAHPRPRVLRCEVNERNIVWLTPEMDANTREALILFHFDGLKAQGRFSVQGGRSKILLSSDTWQPRENDSRWRDPGKAALVHIEEGHTFTAEVSFIELLQYSDLTPAQGQARDWFGFYRKRRRRDTITVAIEIGGRLIVTIEPHGSGAKQQFSHA